MSYDVNDPRSQLSTAAAAPKKPVTDYAGLEVIEFNNHPPSEEGTEEEQQ